MFCSCSELVQQEIEKIHFKERILEEIPQRKIPRIRRRMDQGRVQEEKLVNKLKRGDFCWKQLTMLEHF